MIVIGVTGGIASGKSRVTAELVQRGACAVNADRLGHAVLRLPQVKRQLHAHWGDEVFSRNIDTIAFRQGREKLGKVQREDANLQGYQVNRAAVAQRVFAPPPAGPTALAFLESVTHPWITRLLERRFDRWRTAGAADVAVLDAPVLYKAGWDRFCQLLVFVDAPWEVRVARARERGWSQDQLRRRQASQPSEAYQRDRADVILENGGHWSVTVRQIDQFWVGCVVNYRKNLP